jgi:hypothetical protein
VTTLATGGRKMSWTTIMIPRIESKLVFDNVIRM